MNVPVIEFRQLGLKVGRMECARLALEHHKARSERARASARKGRKEVGRG